MGELSLPNPELVQAENWALPKTFSRTPLILIHDGGGTTFAYHCLPALRRFVYGIRNPHFFSGDVFDGGIPEMGRLYAGWVRKMVAQRGFPARRNPDGSVDILLGGWSLGGLLSLEVARELEDDYGVRVVGIVMVDSIYPRTPAHDPATIAPYDTSEKEKTKNQILSQRAMAEARRMVDSWQLPVWERWTGKRPRTVLLRAKECIPTDSDGISKLDLYRKDTNLGWSQYDKHMFEEVIDVEGHHFDLFAGARIEDTSKAIQKALDLLD